MSFKFPEKYRVISGQFRSSVGENGAFIIPRDNGSKQKLTVIASSGFGWEHVSVSMKTLTPSWGDMSLIKSLFWDSVDTVVQFHPAKKHYVNNHSHCLHLWRQIGNEVQLPPENLIGVKKLGTLI